MTNPDDTDDFETRVEMAELNRDLAELWIDEADLLEIHRNASRWADKHVVVAVNEMYAQASRCKSVLRGARLREAFGYD